MTVKKEQTYLYRNRQIQIPDGYLAVGLIVGVHGLRGELKVELHTDFPERFDVGNQLVMGPELRIIEIESSRTHKGHILLTLAGIKSRNQAEELRNLWLFVDEENAAELDEDTYWIHDIIGLTVQSDDGTLLGTVTNVIPTGANDVYVIQPEGGINKGQELLIPAIADVIVQVDMAQSLLLVRLLPGLIEE